jgi:hypothetical protein
VFQPGNFLTPFGDRPVTFLQHQQLFNGLIHRGQAN